MTESTSKTAVYGALFANIAIAVTKFTAALLTGSSAMWSEGIHSAVDTGNEILMLIGMRRSRRPPDPHHPFGHGKELYFWNLLVAMMILGAGGGVSIYEGALHILHPAHIQNPRWNYLVLGFAFIFEGISLLIALRSFNAQHGEGSLWSKIVASKDPTTYTVIVEDVIAVSGIIVAGTGVYLSVLLRMPALDGVASVLIGLLLAICAIFLMREARGLLVGEGVDRRTSKEIAVLAGEDALVESVARPLTMYLGPENVLLTMDVKFRPTASAEDIAEVISKIKTRIQARFPHLSRIYIEAAGFTAIGVAREGMRPGTAA